MALVSIVLPFRNAELTLRECVDSILSQTLKDFDLIALDDGSLDASAEIVRNATQADHRVQLLQPGRIGLVAALNLGLNHATAPLVARMDADDTMTATRLEEQVNFLRDHPEITLVSCRTQIIPEEAVRDGYREYQRWQNSCVTPEEIASNLYVESPHSHPSVMFRRNEILEIGAYKEGDFPEDYELWLRMASNGYKMAKIPKVLMHCRDHPQRLTRMDQRYSTSAFDRLRADYLSRDPRLHSGREIVIWGAGRNTRKRAAHLLNHGIRCSWWIDIDPDKIGNVIDGRRVEPPASLDLDPKPFVMIYVNNHGARDLIAKDLLARGYSTGRDFLTVG